MIESVGVEAVPYDRYKFGPGQDRWEKIPINVNATSTIVMAFVRVKEAVEKCLEAKDSLQARELINVALYKEINF